MTTMPDDLISYLITLISPPEPYVKAVYLTEINDSTMQTVAGWEKESVTGLIIRGTPTEEQSVEFLRVLKPGAHLILIAPDEEPTGHTGACTIEDAGFEIRDSILFVTEPGRFHYVPKAARAEREAGCAHLPARSGAEAVDREEDTAGLESPRAGAGRTAGQVHNFHPTCKPMAIMEKLLRDVPTDQGPVLDPFMGSGSTGIACLKTGHAFIGIEREPDYLVIADARVRHWDWKLTTPANQGVEIQSDAPERPKEDAGVISFDNFFGFGEEM